MSSNHLSIHHNSYVNLPNNNNNNSNINNNTGLNADNIWLPEQQQQQEQEQEEELEEEQRQEYASSLNNHITTSQGQANNTHAVYPLDERSYQPHQQRERLGQREQQENELFQFEQEEYEELFEWQTQEMTSSVNTNEDRERSQLHLPISAEINDNTHENSNRVEPRQDRAARNNNNLNNTSATISAPTNNTDHNINNNNTTNNNNVNVNVNVNNHRHISERHQSREILHNRPRLKVNSVPLVLQAPILYQNHWTTPLCAFDMLCPCFADEPRRLILQERYLSTSTNKNKNSNNSSSMTNSASFISSSLSDNSTSLLSMRNSETSKSGTSPPPLTNRNNAEQMQRQRRQRGGGGKGAKTQNPKVKSNSESNSAPYGESEDEMDMERANGEMNLSEMPSPTPSQNPLYASSRLQQQQQHHSEHELQVNTIHSNNQIERQREHIHREKAEEQHCRRHDTRTHNVSIYIPKLTTYDDVFNREIVLDKFNNVVRNKRTSVWDYCGHALYRFFCGRCAIAHQTELLFTEELLRGRVPYRVCCEDWLFSRNGDFTRSLLTMLLLDTLSCGILNCCAGVGYAGVGTMLFEWRLRYLLRCRYGIAGSSFEDLCVACWLPTPALVQQSAELAANGIVEHGPCSVVIMH